MTQTARLFAQAFTLFICGGVIAATARPLDAQALGESGQTAVLRAVMDYRLTFLDDRSMYDACSVSKVLESGDSLEDLRAPYAALVDTATRCASVRRELPSPPPVSVRTLRARDDSAAVELVVHHGEYSHGETYRLLRRGRGWIVGGVCLTAGMYSDLRMPSAAGVHPPQ
jgi:hypothetical protein